MMQLYLKTKLIVYLYPKYLEIEMSGLLFGQIMFPSIFTVTNIITLCRLRPDSRSLYRKICEMSSKMHKDKDVIILLVRI